MDRTRDGCFRMMSQMKAEYEVKLKRERVLLDIKTQYFKSIADAEKHVEVREVLAQQQSMLAGLNNMLGLIKKSSPTVRKRMIASAIRQAPATMKKIDYMMRTMNRMEKMLKKIDQRFGIEDDSELERWLKVDQKFGLYLKEVEMAAVAVVVKLAGDLIQALQEAHAKDKENSDCADLLETQIAAVEDLIKNVS